MLLRSLMTSGILNRLRTHRRRRRVDIRCAAEALEPKQLLTSTVGLLVNEVDQAFDGYTLFSPISDSSTTTYLIDNDGRQVNSWESTLPTMSSYILEDGSLLRVGRQPNVSASINAPGASGRIEQFDWDGNKFWEFNLNGTTGTEADRRLHHDIEPLPNGNILMIAWERKSRATAIANGRNPALLSGNNDELWPDSIIEVQPDYDSGVGGTIVWQWSVWDHLIQDFDPTKANFGDVSAHPERIDINVISTGEGAGGVVADWNHFNAVAYNAQLDQIMVSSREANEFWIIDHSTTTAEASGRTGGNSGAGGDLLYRWGNQAAYDQGGRSDQRLYYQHDAQWIEPGLPGEGNILVFNNGWNRSDGTSFSSVEEIVTPLIDTQWYLRNSLSNSPAPTTTFNTFQAPPTWTALSGDWNGDGTDTTGFYDPGTHTFYLNDANSDGGSSIREFQTGPVPSDWVPLAGDWDGDGRDSTGLYDPTSHTFYLKNGFDNSDSSDVQVFETRPVPENWIPYTGDWNGDGRDTASLYDPVAKTFYFKDELHYDNPDDLKIFQTRNVQDNWPLVVGDWNGDGVTSLGVYDPLASKFYLKNTFSYANPSDLIISAAAGVSSGLMPITGDWDGDGQVTPGNYDPNFGTYRLSASGSYGPTLPVWTYASTPRSDFFATIISGAQRQPNGNTLINEGTDGRFFEVTSTGEIVWEYVNPDIGTGILSQGEAVPPGLIPIPGVFANFTFRADRYALDYAGFSGRDLSAGDTIESYSVSFDTIGQYNPDTLEVVLNNRLDSSISDRFRYTSDEVPNNWLSVAGDWDGDGRDSGGVYDPDGHVFYLNNAVDGSADDVVVVSIPDAGSGWLPIAGDWDGDGVDSVGLYDSAAHTFHLYAVEREGVVSGATDFVTRPLPSSWLPFAGDWDGDGIDTVGLYDPTNHTFYMKNELNYSNPADLIVFETRPVPSNWVPIAGDWDGDGRDTVGLYAPIRRVFYLKNKFDYSAPDDLIVVQSSVLNGTWLPIAGNWNGGATG